MQILEDCVMMLVQSLMPMITPMLSDVMVGMGLK